MIRLNAGFSRKVGEPNYSSRGASVNVELELESNLIGDPNALTERIQALFNVARRAVDDELHQAAGNGQAPGNGAANNRFGGNGNGPTPNRPTQQPGSGNGGSPVRRATKAQVPAIRTLCSYRNLDADRVVYERFGVHAVTELTVQQASSLIGELKATPTAGGGNGGGR